MSITHRLKFESKWRAEKVLNSLLSGNIGLQAATYDQMKAEGLFGRVSELSKVSRQHFLEEHGFEPRLSLSFDEDSDGNIDQGEKVMGKAIALILQQEKGDAIFFHVVDTPILRRVSGEISVVKESWSKWLTDALDEAGLEYKLQTVEEIGKVEV